MNIASCKHPRLCISNLRSEQGKACGILRTRGVQVFPLFVAGCLCKTEWAESADPKHNNLPSNFSLGLNEAFHQMNLILLEVKKKSNQIRIPAYHRTLPNSLLETQLMLPSEAFARKHDISCRIDCVEVTCTTEPTPSTGSVNGIQCDLTPKNAKDFPHEKQDLANFTTWIEVLDIIFVPCPYTELPNWIESISF